MEPLTRMKTPSRKAKAAAPSPKPTPKQPPPSAKTADLKALARAIGRSLNKR